MSSDAQQPTRRVTRMWGLIDRSGKVIRVDRTKRDVCHGFTYHLGRKALRAAKVIVTEESANGR